MRARRLSMHSPQASALRIRAAEQSGCERYAYCSMTPFLGLFRDFIAARVRSCARDAEGYAGKRRDA